MATIRIEAADAPFRALDLAHKAVAVISTADAMGLLEGLEIHHLDLASLRELVRRISDAGIGSEVQAALSTPGEELDPETLRRLLDRLAIAIEDSPSPEHELPALGRLFDEKPLAQLLGISAGSLYRYRSGARDVPDEVAARAHFLATVVGELAGAYNDFGIRRWFERKRSLLRGKSPSDLLTGDWDPDDSGPRRVRELARSLGASAAT